tara:strand:+ start:131 stop:358 length:228 start_codon:yes stop_codon:yes gene_type:complete
MIINELMEELKKLRNEMVQANWPAQRLSDIIVIYEDKIIQESKAKEKSLSKMLQEGFDEEQEMLEKEISSFEIDE